MEAYVPPPLWSYTPFVLLLLAIAIFPLVHSLAHWWEKNANKLLLALGLSAATLLFYAFLHPGLEPHHGAGAGHEPAGLVRGGDAVLQVLHHAVLKDYIPFMVLLFSLYTIAGGILLSGDIQARPITNCAFLLGGAVLASFIGTTGASMLLIRPILRTNAERKHKVHTVIFFIFLVSNIGGSLTPLGDPPLFLGYLRGVEFWWTLELAGPYAFLTVLLLVIYYFWDTVAHRRERLPDIVRDETRVQPLRIHGGSNFVWLGAVIACVALVDESRPLPGTTWRPTPYFRELLLLGITMISWLTTPGNRRIREQNRFNFGAIAEVACLFIGIFICMQPPVEYLQHEGPRLGLKTPSAFFWVTGALSSFLDNAPTYVVFFEAAKAVTADLLASGAMAPAQTVTLLGGAGAIGSSFLLAVSTGAVFMGANTYIGNGPNFMVKTIAEQNGIKMPSFFGYMAYSVAILIPLFVLTMMAFLW